MDAVDRAVEEKRVVPRPIVRIFLVFVGDLSSTRGQEVTREAVDFLTAPRPQSDVVDADRLVAMTKLASELGGLNADEAMGDRETESCSRSILDIESR